MRTRLADGKEVPVTAPGPGECALQYVTIIGVATGTVTFEAFKNNGRSLGLFQVVPLVTQVALPELFATATFDLGDQVLSVGGIRMQVKVLTGGPFYSNTGGGGKIGDDIEVPMSASVAGGGTPLTVGSWIGGYAEDGNY